jgi:hypothetical protein
MLRGLFAGSMIPEVVRNLEMPSSASGEMTAGRGDLRYLAKAEPEKARQQLPLEQVPMKGAP